MLSDFENILLHSKSFRNQMNHPAFLQLGHLLELLLCQIKTTKNVDMLCTLFTTLAYTRDIGGGRGERVLTYMMLDIWYEYFPVLAVYALEALISFGYGSWRDIQGLCCYIDKHSIRRPSTDHHPFILSAVEMMIRELRRHRSSQIAKWIPRETSKKKVWLFTLFVEMWGGRAGQFRKTISFLTKQEPPSFFKLESLIHSRYTCMQERFYAILHN